MTDSRIYTDPRWGDCRERVLARDGHRCTVARLLGGRCADALHAHHIVPVADGGAPYDDEHNVGTVCAAHHPQWEALRRYLVHRRDRTVRCPHQHRTAESRAICEARMARQREAQLA